MNRIRLAIAAASLVAVGAVSAQQPPAKKPAAAPAPAAAAPAAKPAPAAMAAPAAKAAPAAAMKDTTKKMGKKAKKN